MESIRESAKVLGLKAEEKEFAKIPGKNGIWRWFVTETGTRTWWSEGMENPPADFDLDLAATGVWSTSWEARYKTLSYLNRIQAKREGGKPDEERVMLNERGADCQFGNGGGAGRDVADDRGGHRSVGGGQEQGLRG